MRENTYTVHIESTVERPKRNHNCYKTPVYLYIYIFVSLTYYGVMVYGLYLLLCIFVNPGVVRGGLIINNMNQFNSILISYNFLYISVPGTNTSPKRTT